MPLLKAERGSLKLLFQALFLSLAPALPAALVNGFESGDIGGWTVNWVGAGGSPGYGFVSAGSAPIQGTSFGNITYSGSTDQFPVLSLNSPPSLAGASVLSLYHNTAYSGATNEPLAI